MATFVKQFPFVENLAEKVFNLGSDTLTLALATTANYPATSVGTLGGMTQIAYTNLSSRVVTTASSAQSAGTYKLTCTDVVLTASGTVAGFGSVLLYSDTAASDELIGGWAYGSDVILLVGETFTVDFDGTNGVAQLA